METKERRERLSQLLAEVAKSDSREAKSIREFIALLAEDAKERLVDAEGVDFPRIQGEARLMERITKQMNAAGAMLGRQQGAVS